MIRTKWFSAILLSAVTLSGAADAHHPDRENHPVTPRIDVIGPIGNNLKPGYRRKYNRPRYLGGKIAYHIAPTSQEAMAWHRAVHSGAYQHPKKHLRIEQHYFYPKPYEALVIGPRRAAEARKAEAAASQAVEIIEEIDVAPLSSPAPQPLPLNRPADDTDMELPEIELRDEAISPSDLDPVDLEIE